MQKAPAMSSIPLRVKLLNDGAALTSGDRDREYGPPNENLSQCAEFFATYLNAKFDTSLVLAAEDVAWLNVLQKIARTFSGHVKLDTYTDAATYAAIAGECATILSAANREGIPS